MKSQAVRLLDVLVLAPAMVGAGLQLRRGRRDSLLGLAMIGAGVATGAYNYRNYLRKREAARAIRPRPRS